MLFFSRLRYQLVVVTRLSSQLVDWSSSVGWSVTHIKTPQIINLHWYLKMVHTSIGTRERGGGGGDTLGPAALLSGNCILAVCCGSSNSLTIWLRNSPLLWSGQPEREKVQFRTSLVQMIWCATPSDYLASNVPRPLCNHCPASNVPCPLCNH